MFYTEKDLKDVLRQLWIYISIGIIILVGGIVGGFVVGLNVNNSLGTIIIGITAFVCVFVFGLLIAPCYNYYKYMLDSLTGRKRVTAGVVKSIGAKTVYKDNKNHYYEIDIEVAPGKFALLLYDANLGKPCFAEGDRIKCLCYENYILKIQDDVKDEE